MPIQVTGLEGTLKAMRGKALKDGVVIADALERAAQVLLNKSQQLVPVDTGALKLSGRVESNGKKGFAAESVVVYGNEAVPYAWVVHERMDIFHEPPTQAKYLSAAVSLVRGVMTNMVKRQISAGIRGTS